MTTPDHTQQEWLQPQTEQQALKRYIETIRERIWLVVAAVAVTTAFAVLYVATAREVYEADVQIVVSPIDDPDGTLAAIGLITESNDPLRAIETATTLILTNSAAEAAADELGLDREPRSILNDISADPVAESNVINVTAEAETAEKAAALADAFAEGALKSRTKLIRDGIDQELPALEARLDRLPAGVTRDTLAARVDQLAQLRAGGDPTLKIVEEALVPRSPVSPRPVPSVIAGILAGLIVGIGAAFALQLLDPRLRREDQLRTRYRLPTLARVPREEPTKGQPLRWDRLSPGSVEAYRTLRAVLARSAGTDGSASILVTSPGPGEGKTTSAMSLAASLALAGKSVILIEGDLRRPAIGESFGISVARGVTSVLAGEASLDEALVTAPVATGNLRLLLAEQAGEAGAELLALPAAQDLVTEAKRLADFVVVDSPPLATVVDALPLARSADEIVLVVRLGSSRLDRIQELAELLADSGIRPTGFVLIGVARQPQSYYMDARQRRLLQPEPRLRGADELQARYRLPMLARVPREDPPRSEPLRWDRLSPGSIEAYRTLRAMLARSAGGAGSATLLVTSAGPGEGKTTSAMTVAASLALAGRNVILLEADVRRPALAAAFGVAAAHGVSEVLGGEADLEESLVTVPVGTATMRLLPAVGAGGSSEPLSGSAAAELIADARRHADFVVVDAPPLLVVPHPLELAQAADEILLVARVGASRLDRIHELAELLAGGQVTPRGFVLVGVDPSELQADAAGPSLASGDAQTGSGAGAGPAPAPIQGRQD